MPAREYGFDVGIGWRPVQVDDCVGQRRHRELFANVIGQQFVRRRRAHCPQCLVGQVSQPTLLHAFCRGINRCQRFVNGRILVSPQDAVLRVDHFETATAFARITEASYPHARLKLRLLPAGEVKKAQRQLAATVTDSYQQVAPATVCGLSKKNLARNETSHPWCQRAELDELGSILVAQRQQEQEILDAAQVQPLQLFRERRSDAGQLS